MYIRKSSSSIQSIIQQTLLNTSYRLCPWAAEMNRTPRPAQTREPGDGASISTPPAAAPLVPWRVVSPLRFTLVEQPPSKLPGTFPRSRPRSRVGLGGRVPGGRRTGAQGPVVFLCGGAWAGSLGGESLRPGMPRLVSSQLPPLTLAPPILLPAALGSSHSGMASAPKGIAAGPLSHVLHVSCRLRPSVPLPCPLLFPAALVCIPGLPDLVSVFAGRTESGTERGH